MLLKAVPEPEEEPPVTRVMCSTAAGLMPPTVRSFTRSVPRREAMVVELRLRVRQDGLAFHDVRDAFGLFADDGEVALARGEWRIRAVRSHPIPAPQPASR